MQYQLQLPNISKSKSNLTMKLGKLIEYNARNILGNIGVEKLFLVFQILPYIQR